MQRMSFRFPRRSIGLAALALAMVFVASSCGVVSTIILGPPRVIHEGQFKISCGGPVRSAPDDPIVDPGQPGVSHNHEFYGNRSTSAFSTFASMVAGQTECADHSGGDRGDTAGYWHPSLLVNGVRQAASQADFYYDTQSAKQGPIHPFPAGLKMIAGDHMSMQPQGTDVIYWGCGNGSSTSKVEQPPQCHSGDDGLAVHIIFPDCWNGTSIDSPDHMSHMAYSVQGDDGVYRCPSSHPVPVPRLTMRIGWDNFNPNPSTLSLSSGNINGMHADYWNTWQQPRLDQLVDKCINESRKCSHDDVNALPYPG